MRLGWAIVFCGPLAAQESYIMEKEVNKKSKPALSLFFCPWIIPLFYWWFPKGKETPFMCHCSCKLLKNHKSEILHSRFFSIAPVLTLLTWWLTQHSPVLHPYTYPVPPSQTQQDLISLCLRCQRKPNPSGAYTEPGVGLTREGQNWLLIIVLQSKEHTLDRQAMLFCASTARELRTRLHAEIQISWVWSGLNTFLGRGT